MCTVGLARALYRRERLSVLKLALVAFDHDVTAVHDKLCYAGAMTVLVRCLQTTMTSVMVHWAEVYQVCHLIEMTYRCSHDAAAHTIESIGTDLLVLLFSILLKDDRGRTDDSPVRVVIRRVACLEVSLQEIDQSPRLLSFLQQMAMLGNEDPVVSLDAMCVTAGLTSHAQSKEFVMESPAFLDNIIKCSQVAAPGTEIKHQIARVLQNLTLHGSNKAKMTKQLIVEQLVTLALPDQCVSTRDQAIRALRHMSVEAKGKLFIVSFEGGQFLKILLDSFSDSILQPVVVDTILSLACNLTASTLVNHPGLVEALATIAASANATTAEKAAQVIKRLSTSVSTGQRGHPTLLAAILSLAGSMTTRIRCWAAKAFLEQARLSGSNFLLVRSPEALKHISTLARDASSEVQDPAIEALLVLTESQSNLKRFTVNGYLLDTLVAAVDRGIEGDEHSRLISRKAILAILNLTRKSCARKRAAKHRGLVACLSRYGVSRDEDEELRQAALHGVVILSPSM